MALRVWWVVGLSLLGLGCKPRHEFLKPNPSPVEQRTVVFPSGLRLIVEQHPGTERVAMSVLVGAGSAQDAQGREGTAHFVEHLAFRSRPAQRLSLWDELDVAGVSAGQSPANAYTSFETTTYLGVVNAKRAREVFPLFASLVVRPLHGVDDATLEVERQVVRNEQLERNSHGGGAYLATIGAAVFGDGQPGSRPISGDLKSLSAITRADLEGFTKQFYAPQRTTVVLVGDLSPAVGEQLVRGAFPREWLDANVAVAPLALSFSKRLEPPVAPAVRPVVEAEVKERQLVFAWAVPGTEALAGTSMELFRNELERASLPKLKPLGIRSRWADFMPGPGASILMLGLVLEPTADLEVVNREIRKTLQLNTPSGLAVRSLAIDELRDEQNLLTHAMGRAIRAFATGDKGLRRFGLNDEGRAELDRIRKDVLTWPRAREVLVVPRVETNDAATLTSATAAPGVHNVVVTTEQVKEQALPLSLGAVKEFTLPNGLRVVLSRRQPVPVASVTLALPYGARQTTRLATGFLDWTLEFNRSKNRDVKMVGAPNVSVGGDVTRLHLSGPAWELPVMLDSIGHALPPDVPWDRVLGTEYILEVFTEQLDRTPEFEVKAAKHEALVRAVMPPGSRTLDLRKEELNDAERVQFTRFVDLAFVPDGAVLVVDGDFDVDATEQVVRDLFTPWSGQRGKGTQRSLGEAPPRAKEPIVVDVPGAAQTTVRFACRLPEANSNAVRGGQQLLAHALGLSFEDELRRERGMTYGVDTDVTSWAQEPNLLTVTAKLDARGRQRALGAFLAKLDELEGAVWEEPVVDLARWRLSRSTLSSDLTSSEVSWALAGEMATGRTLDEAKQLTRDLAFTPLKWVDEAWQSCADSYQLELQGHAPTINAVLAARRAKHP